MMIHFNVSGESRKAMVKAIEDGHIRVGEELPSERDLAGMLGVGRGSLRECLAILEFLGAIDGRGNRKVLLRDADYIQKARTWIECSTAQSPSTSSAG